MWIGLFFIVGGLYSVTVLRENDHERATVHTKHRLTLQVTSDGGLRILDIRRRDGGREKRGRPACRGGSLACQPRVRRISRASPWLVRWGPARCSVSRRPASWRQGKHRCLLGWSRIFLIAGGLFLIVGFIRSPRCRGNGG